MRELPNRQRASNELANLTRRRPWRPLIRAIKKLRAKAHKREITSQIVLTDFGGVEFDPDRYAKDIGRAPPRKSYVILFTPRSGSSWLSEVLTSTERLGIPGEYFSPKHHLTYASAMNANSLVKLVQLMKRQRCRGGVFGVQATYGQLIATFGSEDEFFAHFPPSETEWFFLIRENIVEQAVSLLKKINVNISHSVKSNSETIRSADARFVYDARKIRLWIDHIMNYERESERMFKKFDVSPLRLSYEMLMTIGHEGAVKTFAEALDEPMPSVNGKTRHTKVGTAKNVEYADRFTCEHPNFMAKVAQMRAETILALKNRETAVAIKTTVPI